MDTQKVIDWFGRIIRCENLADLKLRQQETIYQYLTTNSDDDLSEFGEITWEDWLSFGNVRFRYPPPRITEVNWAEVGKFLVDKLGLELLCEDGSLWEE